MDFTWDLSVIEKSVPVLLRGVGLTAEMWVIAFPLSLLIGFFLSLGRISHIRWLNYPCIAFVEIFRNTPVLIQLIWFYYAFPIILGTQLSPVTACLMGLVLNTSAYCTEIYRSGILSIGRGQWEGGKAIGMSYCTTMRRIILPQVFKRMLPAFTNRGIELAKVTSLGSVLAVQEIMYQGRLLSSAYYRPLEIFTTVAAVYFLLIYPGSFLSSRLEQRLGKRD
ncbi:amino acid ABC transporter permease [Burkholderia sp. Ac-20344]|uniref:amino acid ABC transporter permease n=1 Tax=Burkholderia sp. Ac-20344 TaxID=2703890 RepID=UPI00197BCF52|nr:amino acid ABC transporter permease [Burkholderia sp. Ac-20344]MBN3835026.1 amino acid ABC transporter permease [Burkholderia sp. Ac-20344]